MRSMLRRSAAGFGHAPAWTVLALISCAALPMPARAAADIVTLLAAETRERSQHACAAAIDDVNQVLEIDPDNIQALLDRAQSEHALGCEEAAYGNAVEVQLLDPGNASAAAYKPPPSPRVPIKTVPPEPSADDAELWAQWGMTMMCGNRPQRALRGFDRALALGRDRADVLNNRAVALLQLRRYEDAIRDLNAALALRPRYAVAYHNRGTAHFRLGDNAAALADFATALGIMPRLVYVYIVRGQLRLGQISYLGVLTAQQTYQQALLSLVQAKAQRYADTVALFAALGGGWWNRRDVDPEKPLTIGDFFQ